MLWWLRESPQLKLLTNLSPMSSFYSLATIDLNAPSSDIYYIAIYEPYQGGHRVYFVTLGLLALFMWAGLLVGPILAIVYYLVGLE